jgi:integrase
VSGRCRPPPDPLLEAVDLHGAHDFRHTFAAWLEYAGIPARVIDEVMGHEATGRAGQQRGRPHGRAHWWILRGQLHRSIMGFMARLNTVPVSSAR